jgi:hypothetical protein
MDSEAHHVRLNQVRVPLPPVIINQPLEVQELVQVSVSTAGSVQLRQVLGLPVQAALPGVLEQKGESLGWVRDAVHQAVYIKQLQSGVDILIDTSVPTLPVLLRASSAAALSQMDQAAGRLQALLQLVTPEYDRVMAELVDLCQVETVKNAARLQGDIEITRDEIDLITHTHYVEIMVTK